MSRSVYTMRLSAYLWVCVRFGVMRALSQAVLRSFVPLLDWCLCDRSLPAHYDHRYGKQYYKHRSAQQATPHLTPRLRPGLPLHPSTSAYARRFRANPRTRLRSNPPLRLRTSIVS